MHSMYQARLYKNYHMAIKKWMILILSKICERTTFNHCILSHLLSYQETDEKIVFVALLFHKQEHAGGWGSSP